MCLKEEYKSKQQQLEEYLKFLQIPRYMWHVPKLLLETLFILYLLDSSNNHRATILVCGKLIKDIY